MGAIGGPTAAFGGRDHTMKATEASVFLPRAGCEPFNILANAQLAGGWSSPADHSC